MVAQSRLPFLPAWMWLLLAAIWLWACSATLVGQETMIRVPFGGEEIGGIPMVKTSEELYMLSRDGQLRHFLRKDVHRTIKTKTPFSSFSADELKHQLAQEFGRRYEVSAVGKFVVVNPVGGRSDWPKRFDDLYRSFLHYFSARGWRPDNPEFPLVAIVFSSRNEFDAYSTRQGDPTNANVLGYYSPRTNRIVLYDQGGGVSEEEWEKNAATIVHEAAHQTAFNTGIHNRFSPPPRWVIEGLGTMFEAPGVCNSYRYPDLSQRVNEAQRVIFTHYLESRYEKGDLARLIGSDNLFRESPGDAYALAWATSFYLAESQPREYITYLRKTADREAFSMYPAGERLVDFTRVFGDNLDLIEQRVIRYVKQLPR